jgi:DNA-damage-inducible protein D
VKRVFLNFGKKKKSNIELFESKQIGAKILLRIIQSILSPKAEHFKLWLAQVASDRLATQRTRELYKLEGYPDDRIEKQLRSNAIREELTEEWKNRGVKEQKEYSILTSEISKATFGLIPS